MCSSKLISKVHYPDVLAYVDPRAGVRGLPEGKRSMTGWLSTCSVALPPLRVNRTTWYLPSLTITALSSMVMSSVPTLKITPTFPRSYKQRAKTTFIRRHSGQIIILLSVGYRSPSFLLGDYGSGNVTQSPQLVSCYMNVFNCQAVRVKQR